MKLDRLAGAKNDTCHTKICATCATIYGVNTNRTQWGIKQKKHTRKTKIKLVNKLADVQPKRKVHKYVHG